MRILAVSDEVVGLLETPAVRDRFAGVELVLGCGDLPASYLEYLVTQLNVPLLYVPGNHDPDVFLVPGAECIDGRVVLQGSLVFAGLGGSPRYKREGRHQYSEVEMGWRAAGLLPALLLGWARRRRGVDVLVTHAPMRGVHDGPDVAHRGFRTLRALAAGVRPQVMVHGHKHIHSNLDPSETRVDGVRVVNVFPYRIVDVVRA